LPAIGVNTGFEAVTNGQKFIFGHDLLTAVFKVIFKYVCLYNRIDRTRLFAKSAIYTLEQIDVVTRGAPCAIVTAG
jgi:hypothetical protein